MADGVIPDLGELYLAEVIQDTFNTGAGGWTPTLYLYKNDYTPVAGSDVGDFTEADFPGYSRNELNNWSTPTTDDDGNALMTDALHLYEMEDVSPTNTVYGYLIALPDVGGDPDRIVGAVRFDEPVEMNAVGAQLTVLPVLKFKNCVIAIESGTGSV